MHGSFYIAGGHDDACCRYLVGRGNLSLRLAQQRTTMRAISHPLAAVFTRRFSVFRPNSYLSFLTIIALCIGAAIPLHSSTTIQQTDGKGQSVRQIAQLPAKAKRYALLIGVDSYDDGQISGLLGAANDTRILEDALVNNAGFDRDRIIRLSSDQARDRHPTRGNIFRYLSNALKAVPPDGLLLLAFSGHGIERNGRAFLLPTDAQVNDDISLLESTALEVATINQMIRDRRDAKGTITGVNQVIILLDACRNDPTSGKDASENRLTKAYDFNLRNSGVQAFVTLYATSVGSRAYEDRTRRQGYFITEVVAALQGVAANDKGEITLERLIEHIEDKVPTRVMLQTGQEQKPFARIEGYRANALVLATAATTAIVTPPPITPPRPTTLTPVIALPNGVSAGALKSTSFTTARVAANGRVTKQSGGPVQSFSETVNGVEFEMVAIPGGRFQMGSPTSEAGHQDDEVLHWVRVSDYWMGRYEVTQGQWKAVMGSLPPNMSDLGGEFKGEALPVVRVSWVEVQTFLAKLNQMTNGGWRLPTEAEWEYAARGGMVTPFAFGATITPEVMNYDGNDPSGNATKGVYRKHPVPVGSLGLANGIGLYDMPGNVWEWCSDWYGAYSTSEVSNPKGPGTGPNRVNRGGSWCIPAANCRSAIRGNNSLGYRSFNLGFRLVGQ
jgi:formylglycine-generating enzyme required for sulfatase activity